ncbi:MAG: hypothetical protein RIT43_2103 [Bacteroidota bacterium]
MRHSSALLLILILLTSSLERLCSQTIYSPWSSFGIGDRSQTEHGIFTGLGNSRISVMDSTVLNFYNPSSYSQLSKGLPLYSLGLNSRLTQLQSSQQNTLNFNLIPDHFAMAFGLKNFLGLAFGLKPFTRMGYDISSRSKVGSDSIKYTYRGKGGSHEVFLGLSTDLIHLKSTRISVGGNIGYIFGNTLKERQSVLIQGNSIVGGIDWNEIRLNALHYELAANFKQKLGTNQSISFSAVWEPSQSLKASSNSYLFYGNVDDPELYDTLSATTDIDATVDLAGRIQYGFSWTHWFKDARKDNSVRNSELALHLNYSKALTAFTSTNAINASEGWNIGIQYTPETDFLENSSNASFLERAHYRAGYYQIQLPYTFNGKSVFDQGYTLGIGIPVTSFRTLSSINLSVSLGERADQIGPVYRERYLGFSLGIILAPSNFDKWFLKRKLD